MKRRWLLALLVSMVILEGAYALSLRTRLVRTETVLGEYWSNSFTRDVLHAIYDIRTALQEWASAGNAPVDRLQSVRDAIRRIQFSLSDTIQNYQRAYPSTSVTVPRYFVLTYLDQVHQDLSAMTGSQIVDQSYQLSETDIRTVSEYATDFSSFLTLIAKHFPD